MPTGGFLRTNFRRTGQQPITAIGGIYPFTSYAASALSYVQGSYGGFGAGTNLPYNGLIMGSVIGSQDCSWVQSGYGGATVTHVIVISAYGAMSGWFGAGAYTSGYKILPINIMPKQIALPSSPTTSGEQGPYLWASVSTGTDSCFGVNIAASTYSVTGSECSLIDFIWVGFICSSP